MLPRQLSSLPAALRRWAAVLSVLALGACAEAQFASHSVKTIGGLGSSQGQVGRYKVGKPYQISGIWYYPKEDLSYRETGIASWYGPKFHGKRTANGEIFDQNALTAAHRTLPMPSMVRVTNLENGRALELRINDRGPFANGRIIDVSRKAAELLGFRHRGTAKVRVEILELESRQLAAAARRGAPPANSRSGGAARAAPPAVPKVAVATQSLEPKKGSGAADQVAPQAAPRAAPQAATQAASQTATGRPIPIPAPDGQVVQYPVRPSSIFIQAGAFLSPESARSLGRRLSRHGRTAVTPARIKGRQFYRVRLGPITSVQVADRLLATLYSEGHHDAQVVVD